MWEVDGAFWANWVIEAASRRSIFDRIRYGRRGPQGHEGSYKVVLSDLDRNLLKRCLAREPRSWEDFVDRFLGLIAHVVDHTAQCRSIHLGSQDREDIMAEVFLTLVQQDFAVLRRFRGHSSLATYLTVIARRVVVRSLLARQHSPTTSVRVDEATMPQPATAHQTGQAVMDREELQRLLERLSPAEAEVVRMYHLEGKTYREISEHTGMPENSIGPTLSRARSKMQAAAHPDLSHT